MSSEGKEASEALEETHVSKKAKTLEDKPPDSTVKSAAHLAQLARKYLAIPVSSAPSERVFIQLKLIVELKRRRMDPARIELFSFSDAIIESVLSHLFFYAHAYRS